MKRIIKFRGKDLKTGEWLYGSLVFDCDKKPMIFVSGYSHTGLGFSGASYVDPETVGQFTGLHDKYGEDIYEGDILRLKKEDCLVVVGFNDAKGLFGIRFSFEYRIGEKPLGWWLTNHDFELVGNRFDNPSLLKGGYE